ncbi:MAG: FkbM family methyltransferase [Ilumatobacteraceae bacterium]
MKIDRPLDRFRSKARELAFEGRTVPRLGTTWVERLTLMKFLAMLYAARIVPTLSRGWQATIRVRNKRYVVGLRTSEIYVFHEIYEIQQYDRDENYMVQPGWTVLDVGANVGVFTVHAVTRGATVYAFEPNPDSCGRLRRNVTMNNLSDRVQVFETALGDESGVGEMIVERGGTTGGVVVRLDNLSSEARTVVSVDTLDAIMPLLGLARIDLLKMDIEGAEVEALRGAEQTLPMVQRAIIEYHSRDLLAAVREILVRSGFSEDMILDYYPEDGVTGQEEVGILYARRTSADRQA